MTLPEDVRMPVHQLVHDALDDVVDGEAALATPELGLKDHLQQEVAQLFAQGPAVVRVDGVDDLARLFEDVLAQRLERLLPVPGAPAGAEEAPHHPDQADERRPVLPLDRGHARAAVSSKWGVFGVGLDPSRAAERAGFASGMAPGRLH